MQYFETFRITDQQWVSNGKVLPARGLSAFRSDGTGLMREQCYQLTIKTARFWVSCPLN